jgi:hypothetical protein
MFFKSLEDLLTDYINNRKFAIDGFHEALSKEVDPSWNVKINILEIGGFTTKGLDNVQPSNPHPAYVNTPITQIRKIMADPENAYRTAKPPSSAAKILYDIVDSNDVPLRVPVGLDAIAILKGRAEEIGVSTKYAEKWNEILQ